MSRPWKLTSIVNVFKCSLQHTREGTFWGSPVEVQSSSDGNMYSAASGEQEIPLSPWQRHAPASEWRQPGPWASREHTLFPVKSKESFPFSLSHGMILVSGTEHNRNRVFGVLVGPLVERVWPGVFQTTHESVINIKTLSYTMASCPALLSRVARILNGLILEMSLNPFIFQKVIYSSLVFNW